MNYKAMGRNILSGTALLFSVAASAVGLSPVTITQVNSATDGSDNILIEGRVNAAAGVSSLDINGYPTATFDGQRFSLLMPKTSDYQVNLYSLDGTSQAINYAAASAPVDSAIQVVVGNQLMQDVGGAMGRLLADLDLNEVLGIGPDQCILDTWFLAGCDFYIKQLALVGTPNIDLFFTPGEGEELTINVDINIPQAVLGTKVKRGFWWGYFDTTMTTNDIRMVLQIGVKATEDQSIKLVMDEASDLQLYIGNMRVQSNSLAAYLIPLFKDAISGIVNTSVAKLVGPLLNYLPIPSIPLDLPLDIDGDSVNDAEFAIRMNAELLDVLASGDGQAVLAGAIYSAQVAPGREVLGSRRIAGMLPSAQGVSATTDLTAAVSVNLVNQILTALYQSGIDQNLEVPLTVGDLGSFGQVLAGFGYSLTDNLLIGLNFGAVPEMQVNNDSRYPLGMNLILPQMGIEMKLVTGEGEQLLLGMVGDFKLETSLGAESNGQLHLDLYKANLLGLDNLQITGGALPDQFGAEMLKGFLPPVIASAIYPYVPMINELLNAARLELDIGQVLGDWLNAEFPSVPVAGYVTETGVSDDEAYMQVGLGLDFD